ncbi:MAG: tyrosine-type recombinase/integrase [candidate division Zixibacteria bacterium]|nr:tyrosine-type recombinase/integrase [candidate division Zixibacteria bacterium]
MATLFRKDDFWWINYRFNGERFRFSTGTRSRKLAEIKLNDLKVKLFKGEVGVKPIADKKIEIPELFRRYKEYLNSISNTDKSSDYARLRNLQEFMARKGVRYPDSINPEIINIFTTSVLAGMKPKTIRNYIALLKTILNKAVEWELIEKNPIARVKLPKNVKTFHFFEKQEVEKMIAAAEEPLKSVIIMLVNSGMRKGEFFSLRWRDIDFKAESIRVWPYDGYSPKGKRPRQIPMSVDAKEVLIRLSKGRKADEHIANSLMSRHQFSRQFLKLMKKIKIKGRPHDLRHTFASHLAMAGTPIPVIQEFLGHSSISTTMIYAHLSPNIHKKEIAKLPF